MMSPHESKPSSGSDHHTPDRSRVQLALQGVIAFAVLMFLLVQASFVLISLAIALILFSLMTQAINSISRLRIGRYRVAEWVATICAFLLISSTLLALSGIVVAQVNKVLSTSLKYTDDAQRAVAQVFSWLGADVQGAVLDSMRTIGIPGYMGAVAGQAGNILSASVLIILFVAFLFAERFWFPAKLVILFGDERRAARVRALISSIMHRVNYYLLVKTGVSAVTGLMVYVVMLIFGLEFATAMGILSFILNFLPSIGSIIATVLVALVTYLELGSLASALAVFLIIGVIQFVNGNLIDPMLLGRTLQMSSLGIIISLAFWGAVWGVAGMFLAVPMMLAVMMTCARIPVLRPVAIMLSREGLLDDDVPQPETES